MNCEDEVNSLFDTQTSQIVVEGFGSCIVHELIACYPYGYVTIRALYSILDFPRLRGILLNR